MISSLSSKNAEKEEEFSAFERFWRCVGWTVGLRPSCKHMWTLGFSGFVHGMFRTHANSEDNGAGSGRAGTKTKDRSRSECATLELEVPIFMVLFILLFSSFCSSGDPSFGSVRGVHFTIMTNDQIRHSMHVLRVGCVCAHGNRVTFVEAPIFEEI